MQVCAACLQLTSHLAACFPEQGDSRTNDASGVSFSKLTSKMNPLDFSGLLSL